MTTLIFIIIGLLLLWWAFHHLRLMTLLAIVAGVFWCAWGMVTDLMHGQMLGGFFNAITAVLLITLFTYVYNGTEEDL